MNTAMHTAQGAQINFGDLTPYLSYDQDRSRGNNRKIENCNIHNILHKGSTVYMTNGLLNNVSIGSPKY
jgi:hypothetical protein